MMEQLKEVLEAKSSSPAAREAVLLAFGSVLDAAGIQAEPFVEPLLPTLFTLAGDKV